jgi:hypothetical protein
MPRVLRNNEARKKKDQAKLYAQLYREDLQKNMKKLQKYVVNRSEIVAALICSCCESTHKSRKKSSDYPEQKLHEANHWSFFSALKADSPSVKRSEYPEKGTSRLAFLFFINVQSGFGFGL